MILLSNDELITIQNLCYDKIHSLEKAIKETCEGEVKEAVKESIEKHEKLKLYISSKIVDEY
jgi:ribosomal protein S13